MVMDSLFLGNFQSKAITIDTVNKHTEKSNGITSMRTTDENKNKEQHNEMTQTRGFVLTFAHMCVHAF